MTRAIADLVPAVRERSGGRCEAMWSMGYRCGRRADEVHHRIPRSRASVNGDHLLDLAGVIHHLADLCAPCHTRAEHNPDEARAGLLTDGPLATRLGITVSGSIRTAPSGQLEYVGSHPEFTARYPQKDR